MAGFIFFAPQPAKAGAADNVSGWLWSGTVGWISLNCTNFGTCGASNYGLKIIDLPDDAYGKRASLSGYAWSGNFGWICFGATCDLTTPAVKNPENTEKNYAYWRDRLPLTPAVSCTVDADCPLTETCSDALGNRCVRNSQFYGWARVLSLGSAGWISLNCYNEVQHDCSPTLNYFVAFDKDTGDAFIDDKNRDVNHYGWSGNTDGTGIGWVDFSRMHSTWVPASIGRIQRPAGIFEPDVLPKPAGVHPSTFDIKVLNVFAPGAAGGTQYNISCQLGLPNGKTITLGHDLNDPLGYHGVTETLSYTITPEDSVAGGIQQNKIWFINSCRLSGPFDPATSCAGDADCAGGVCDLPNGGFCRPIVAASGKRPLFTHLTTWTLFDTNQDFYDAVKCFASFPGQFFRNATRCDFAGDASFSMAMARGIDIDRTCTDCTDRFCQGISYFCNPQRKPTRCVWDNVSGDLSRCTDLTYKPGDLCCTKQPISLGSPFSSVVNGLECTYGDPNDGYYDCDCLDQQKFDASPDDDCFAPGYEYGDLCCNSSSEVVKESPPTP